MGALYQLIEKFGVDRFFDTVFERDHHFFCGGFIGQAEIVGAAGVRLVDDLLSDQAFFGDRLRVSSQSIDIEPGDISNRFGLVDVDRVMGFFGKGASIIINQAQERSGIYAALCADASALFQCQSQVNCYVSPPGSQGFPAHWDNHDVFAIQIYGQKTWELFELDFLCPDHSIPFNKDVHKPGAKVAEYHVGPGDVLYVPRGQMHRVFTTDDASIHLTLGLLQPTVRDLLRYMIDTAFSDVEALRRAVPRDAEALATLDSALRALGSDNTDWVSVLASFRANAAADRAAPRKHRFLQALEVPQISSHTEFRAVPQSGVEIQSDGDGTELLVRGERHHLTGLQPEQLSDVLSPDWKHVRDITCVAKDTDKISLVQELVRRGAAELRLENTGP